MKAERRHELRTNALSQFLDQLPEIGRKYGGKILLGLIAISLVIVLLRHRSNTAAQREQEAWKSLATARSAITQLKNGEFLRAGPDQMAAARDGLILAANDALDRVQREATDPKALAEALADQGDLSWYIANTVDLPTTRPAPATAPSLQTDSLKDAEKAYQAVLSKYPEQKLPVATARFGLAAVAENRGQWDEAAKQYDAIINEPQMMKGFKDQASVRKAQLPVIQQPVWLAATQPATMPEMMPSATQPVVIQSGTIVIPPSTRSVATQPAATQTK